MLLVQTILYLEEEIFHVAVPTVSVATGDTFHKNWLKHFNMLLLIENNTTNRTIKYGPYLTPKEGSKIGWKTMLQHGLVMILI